MKSSKVASANRIKPIIALRKELDDRIGSNADVIGSMVGLKFKCGAPTKRLGITYFVRQKIPKAELRPKQRVPSRLNIGGLTISTDIVAWPQMEEQMSQQGTILFDGRVQGTLSCFGISQAGAYGVSCAHCLTGIDGNPATPTGVAAYVVPPGQFLSVGQSVFLAYSPGVGAHDNFGYLDCGLFDLRGHIFASRAANSQFVEVVEDIHGLVGSRLTGISALNAPNTASHIREAQVVGVEAEALGERSDVVLSVLPPGTFKGDSGMLWVTPAGQAVAIHARGEITAGIQGSHLTTGMSAKRVAKALSVRLSVG